MTSVSVARARSCALLLAVATLTAACHASNAITGDLAITNVTLIDGTSQPPLAGQTIVIAGDSIVAVLPSEEVRPQVKTTIDGRGKFVMPGLWDMHVHLLGYGAQAMPLFLANGVTSIRDLGDPLESSLSLRADTRSGTILGPTMLISGPVLDAEYVYKWVANTPMKDGRLIVGDSASGVKMTDSLADRGVDHIKVHAMTPTAAYAGIIAQAKKRGLFVVGHVPDAMTLDDAIAAGQRTIEHDSQLEMAEAPNGAAIHDWAYGHQQQIIAATQAKPTIMPIFNYRLLSADSAMAVFDSASAAAFAQKVAKLPVWFDPTLVVLEVVFLKGEPGHSDLSLLKYAPAAMRSFSDGGESDKPLSEAERTLGRKRFANGLTALTPLVRAGVKIVTGTDVPISPLVPGFSLQRELQLLVEAGMTPHQAIQAGTRNSAEAAGKLARVGTIERGKVADLVMLDADPTTNIKNTTAIRAVVTRGRFLDRAKLDSMLGEAEAYAKSH